MATIYEPKEMRQELGQAITEKSMVGLAWVLVKLVRHGRVRCRNNKALNNYMSKAFPELRFNEIPKVVEFGRRKGETYMGLQIVSQDGEADGD